MPSLFVPMKVAIIPLLMLIMFCMGMTLQVHDFFRTWSQPKRLIVGLLLQYTIMPITAYLLSILLGLSSDLALGLILVGCSSGGTASNVICYLARANVALSVSLTFCSSLLAVLLLPMLVWLFAGTYVPVEPLSLLMSVAKMVLIPIILGLLLNHFASKQVDFVRDYFPIFSMISIIIIIAIIVALNAENIAELAGIVIIAVILHNLLGLLLGYTIALKIFGDKTTAKTVAIEVGMQNSGLSVALAIEHFTKLAALPGAVFSIWHNLSGSLLAAIWRKDATPTDSRSD